MSSITPVCFLYEGWRGVYNHTFVNALNLMLDTHYTGGREPLVCITDNAKGVRCKTFPLEKLPPIETKPGHPNNYNKLRIFDPRTAEAIGSKLWLFDLDVLILSAINSLATDHDFRVLKGAYAPYNTSMMLLRAGTHAHVWETFDPATVEATLAADTACRYASGKPWVGSDQRWLGRCVKEGATWDERDGVVSFHTFFHTQKRYSVPKSLKMVYFAGPRKPWDKYHMLKWPDLYTRYMWYWKRGNGL